MPSAQQKKRAEKKKQQERERMAKKNNKKVTDEPEDKDVEKVFFKKSFKIFFKHIYLKI